jgi:hypothetical protein
MNKEALTQNKNHSLYPAKKKITASTGRAGLSKMKTFWSDRCKSSSLTLTNVCVPIAS